MAELSLSQAKTAQPTDKIPFFARVPVILAAMFLLMAAALVLQWTLLRNPNWTLLGGSLLILAASALAIGFLPASTDRALLARARSLLANERRLFFALTAAYLAIGIPSVLGL